MQASDESSVECIARRASTEMPWFWDWWVLGCDVIRAALGGFGGVCRRTGQTPVISGAMSVTKKEETEDRYDGGENGRDPIATIKIGIQ